LALRAFYAQKDTVIPVKAALLSFVVNIALMVALMGWLSTVGLAVASTVASAVQAVYLQLHLARKHAGLAFHFLVGDLAKIVVASVVMTGVVWAAWSGWIAAVPRARMLDVFGMVAIIALGVAVYGGIVWALRIEGREDVTALLGRFKARLGAAR
jgi:putative peptidoglycan lipid II flippase